MTKDFYRSPKPLNVFGLLTHYLPVTIRGSIIKIPFNNQVQVTSNYMELVRISPQVRLQLHGAIYHPDSSVLMPCYNAGLKATRCE